MKRGRNDPCPCGSGRKYKHCCQSKDMKGRQRVDVAQLMQAAIAHHGAGHLAAAEEACRMALQSAPAHADALNLLGLIAHQTGHGEDAVRLIRQAIAAKQGAPDYHNNLGNILVGLGRLAEAEACFRELLAFGPSADAHNNLGSTLQRQGRMREAAEAYRCAVALRPESHVMWNNLGFALQLEAGLDEAALDEAARCYQRALEIAPGYRDALLNLSNMLSDREQYCQAGELYRRLLAVEPGFALAHLNFGSALQRQGRHAESLASFKAAFTIQPDFIQAWQNYLFVLNYAPGYSAQEIFAEHARFGNRFEEAAAKPQSPHKNSRDPGRRLKIGYVSADFRAHAVAYFIEPVLAQHDHAQVEVYCYSNHAVADEVTLRLKLLAPHWREIAEQTDEAVVELIRQDGIDILVDLAGHTAGNRLGVFMHKPAPVQASWLGYLCTTGLRSIDYRITDVSADPVGLSERYYSEQLLRLPDTFAVYQPTAHSPAVDTLPAMKNGYVSFASFNNLAKMTPEVRTLWAGVLLAVPGSRLMLKTKGLDDAKLRQQLVEDFARHDVSEDRLELVAWDGAYTEHLNRYNQVDIGLDPFPCNGGTTSFDALWMGVPVVTLAGDRFISRMGVSMLTSLGLTELIAHTPEEYVAIAARLAGDPGRLAALRAGLRGRMEKSPLTDAKRFTLNLEQAYREMWTHWCSQPQGEAR